MSDRDHYKIRWIRYEEVSLRVKSIEQKENR